MIRQQNVRIIYPTQEHLKLEGTCGYIRWDSSHGARLNDLPKDKAINFFYVDQYENLHHLVIGAHELAPTGDAFDYSIEEDSPTATAKPDLDTVDGPEIETAETGVKPLKPGLDELGWFAQWCGGRYDTTMLLCDRLLRALTEIGQQAKGAAEDGAFERADSAYAFDNSYRNLQDALEAHLKLARIYIVYTTHNYEKSRLGVDGDKEFEKLYQEYEKATHSADDQS